MNSYTKINYVNGSAPPLNAENLNHMDSGIEAVTEAVTALESEVETVVVNVNKLGSDVVVVINQVNGKQDISNLVNDIRYITDPKKNYPSISYLDGYYHDAEDIDAFLEEKADKSELTSGLNEKQTAQYVADTIKTVDELIALNDVNTVYHGVISGFSKSFGQTSDTAYIGFRMWFELTSPKEAKSYARIISLSDGTIWTTYGSGANINYRQISYNKKQVDKLLGEKYDASNVETGSGALTTTSTRISSANFEYQKFGDYVTVNVFIGFAESSMGATTSIQLTGIPFVNESAEAGVLRIACATSKKTSLIAALGKSAITILTPNAVTFAADETMGFTVTYKITKSNGG